MSTKTVLFASLIVAMILPFSATGDAKAQSNSELNLPEHITPIQVKVVVSPERQVVIDQVAQIGKHMENAQSEEAHAELQSQIDRLKPAMLKHGLTPTFDFGETSDAWERKLNAAYGEPRPS